eukprot:scpid92697/ scgid1715/ 
MARPTNNSTRTPGRKAPRLKRVVAKIAAGGVTPATQVKQATPRKRGAEIKTPDRWRIVTAYMALAKGRDRLPRGSIAKLKSQFPHLQLNARSVQRIVENYKKQAQDTATKGNIRMTRRRASLCGGFNLKLTPELAKKMVEINDKAWGRLSCKKLAGELTEAGYPCSEPSVRRWCQALGAVRRRRYIKPKLTVRHRLNRLSWAIDQYNRGRRKFVDNLNMCHGDEKWYYLMRDGTIC